MATSLNVKQLKSLISKGIAGRYSIGNGLYFRLSDEGTGFWVVRYSINKKRREITIGRYPDLSLADANAETALIKKDIKNNIDPLAERKRNEQPLFNTVNDLAADWLEDCAKRLQHPNIPKRVYTKDIAPVIGELAIKQVNPRDIRSIITNIAKSSRPTIANDALLYCKQLFRHGIKLDLLTYNPAEAFTVSDAGGIEKSRDRFLSIDEVEIAFKCFRNNKDQFARENYLACALLLQLGIRKGELIAAKWEEFDFEQKPPQWNIPKERGKTGTPISVPLPKNAVEWFQELKIRAYGSEFVFPNRRTSKRFGHISPDTLNAAIQKLFKEKKFQIPHFSVHDLRRTCRSLLASQGVPGHVAERCLNHKLKGVEGIYDRYDYFKERYDAFKNLSKLITPLINT